MTKSKFFYLILRFESEIIKNLHFNLLPKIQDEFLKDNIDKSLIFKILELIFQEKEKEFNSYLQNLKSNIFQSENASIKESNTKEPAFKNSTVRAKVFIKLKLRLISKS